MRKAFCSKCFTTDPPGPCIDDKGEEVWWWLVQDDESLVQTGVEPSGEIGYRFVGTPERNPDPDLDPGQKIMCSACVVEEIEAAGGQPYKKLDEVFQDREKLFWYWWESFWFKVKIRFNKFWR